MTDHQLPSRPAPPTGCETVDTEHGIQLGLVEASLTALRNDTENASELVAQLFTYSQAHFLYEQLLMRRTAQPNYEGHVQEHDKLVGQLHSIRDLARKADYAEAAQQLRAHERELLEHILGWDMSLG